MPLILGSLIALILILGMFLIFSFDDNAELRKVRDRLHRALVSEKRLNEALEKSNENLNERYLV